MMYKIDSHAHILPHSWPDYQKQFGYGGFIKMDHYKEGSAKMMRDDGRFFREVQANCWSPEHILKDMDQYHVNKMVLCTVPVLFNYWMKIEEHALEWVQMINNHLIQVQRQYPQRFISLGTLPMQFPQLAVKELHRLKNEGVNGVEIGSHIEDKNLDHPDFHPIWKACEELNISVMVHPWDMMGQEKMPNYFLPWLVGMPAETSLAICSMIFGGIFDRYPKLKVMFAHGGGSFPFTLGRVSHGWHCRPDLCDVNKIQDPRAYIGKFWVDGITHDIDALKFLIKTVGADKITYGTDYPFPLGDLEHGQFIHDSDLPDETKHAIFSQNLLSFLSVDENK